LLEDQSEAMIMKRRVNSHTIIEGKLYKKGMSTPFLKFLARWEPLAVLKEVHEGIAGQNL
jgi:hypothetical protein